MIRISAFLLLVLLLNSAYLAAFATPSLFYFVNVVLHMVLGLALGLVWARRTIRERANASRAVLLSSAVLAAGGLCGIAIMVVGAAGRTRWLLPLHIGLIAAGGAPAACHLIIRDLAVDPAGGLPSAPACRQPPTSSSCSRSPAPSAWR